MRANIKLYIALHIFLMIYSSAGVLSKLAAGQGFLSLPFILFYVGEILILAFYAIGWQQFIKRMPLSVAYANKAVTVVWGCVWGVVIFQEHLTVGKVIGALIVLVGVALYGYADEKNNGAVPLGMDANTNIEFNDASNTIINCEVSDKTNSSDAKKEKVISDEINDQTDDSGKAARR